MKKADGSLKLCFNSKALNDNLSRETFKIPKFEQIVLRLVEMKIFTTLDEKDAHWQIEVDKTSSRFCS